MTAQWVGEIALITVAAVVVGYAVLRLWPKSQNPQLFAFLVPFAAVGVLAYLGSSAAAGALVLLVAVAALAMMFGLS